MIISPSTALKHYAYIFKFLPQIRGFSNKLKRLLAAFLIFIQVPSPESNEGLSIAIFCFR
jgi:hypothetical protein